MKGEANDGTRVPPLLELVVVLALIGLLVLLVGPAAGNQSRRVRIQTGAEQLSADLERARSEALEWGTTVSLEVTGSDRHTMDFIGDRKLEGIPFASTPSEVEFAPLGSRRRARRPSCSSRATTAARCDSRLWGFAGVED